MRRLHSFSDMGRVAPGYPPYCVSEHRDPELLDEYRLEKHGVLLFLRRVNNRYPYPFHPREQNAVKAVRVANRFLQKFAHLMLACLSCYDRMIFKGYLQIGGDEDLSRWVDGKLKIRRKDFIPQVAVFFGTVSPARQANGSRGWRSLGVPARQETEGKTGRRLGSGKKTCRRFAGRVLLLGDLPEHPLAERQDPTIEVSPIVEPDDAVVERLAELAHVNEARAIRILDRMVRGDQDASDKLVATAINVPCPAQEIGGTSSIHADFGDATPDPTPTPDPNPKLAGAGNHARACPVPASVYVGQLAALAAGRMRLVDSFRAAVSGRRAKA
jgi:hypothetical protein